MIGECLGQEFSEQTWIDIPKELMEIYKKAGRPSGIYIKKMYRTAAINRINKIGCF